MFIGLISDSHGVFSPEFKEFLRDVDEIWHAGDFGGGLDTEAEIAIPRRGRLSGSIGPTSLSAGIPTS